MVVKKGSIGELCDVGDGTHSRVKRLDKGVMYLTSKNFKEHGLDLCKLDYISEEDYSKHFKDDSEAITKPISGDILMSIIGTMGVPYIVKEKDRFGLSSSVAIIRPSIKILKEYLYYWMLSPMFQQAVENYRSGVAQGFLSLGAIKNLPVKYPSIDTQNKIVNILKSYDNLIENNLKRIKLLEESAELIYKEWFVNFRFPGYEKAKFIDGIPEGWSNSKVGDLLDKVSKTKRVKKADYLLEGEIPVVDQSRDYIGGYTNDGEAKQTRIPAIVFGDHTRIVKYIKFPFARGADGTQIIYSNTSSISQQYFYFAIKNINLSNYSYARHFKYLKEEEIFIPSMKVMNNFTEIVSNTLSQIKILREQNEKLKQARDILIPKLITGEMEV